MIGWTVLYIFCGALYVVAAITLTNDFEEYFAHRRNYRAAPPHVRWAVNLGIALALVMGAAVWPLGVTSRVLGGITKGVLALLWGRRGGGGDLP